MVARLADPAPGAARLGRHPDRQHVPGGADRRRDRRRLLLRRRRHRRRAAIFIGGMLVWRRPVLRPELPAIRSLQSLRQLIPHRVERRKEQRFWYRWSRFIQHRPWPSAARRRGVAPAARHPAVLDPPRLRRLRQLPGGAKRSAGPTTCSPRASAPAPTGRCSSPSRARPPATRPPSASSPPTIDGDGQRRHGVPLADHRQPGTRHRLPGERAAGRRHDRPWSTRCATTSSRRPVSTPRSAASPPRRPTSPTTSPTGCRCSSGWC